MKDDYFIIKVKWSFVEFLLLAGATLWAMIFFLSVWAGEGLLALGCGTATGVHLLLNLVVEEYFLPDETETEE